jgi:AraC-like DNA-binding protein
VKRAWRYIDEHLTETIWLEDLSEIAQANGFADQSHFCRHFRQITRQTPAAWAANDWMDHAPDRSPAEAGLSKSKPRGEFR